MSFEQAFNELKLTKELNTDMLAALGVRTGALPHPQPQPFTLNPQR